MRKKPYKEGDWIAIPIASGFVIARIARVGRRGGVLLGYFFEPLFKTLPTRHDIDGLSPAAAFNIAKFGDLGIVEEGWPIIDSPPDWNRAEWPMPAFGRINILRPWRGMLTRYDEDQLTQSLGETQITAEQAIQFPEAILWGHIALQGGLELYFLDGVRVRYPTRPSQMLRWYHGLPDVETTNDNEE